MTIEVAQIHSEFYQMEKMKELAGTVNRLVDGSTQLAKNLPYTQLTTASNFTYTVMGGSPTITTEVAPNGMVGLKIVGNSFCAISITSLIGSRYQGDMYVSLYGSQSLTGLGTVDLNAYFGGGASNFRRGRISSLVDPNQINSSLQQGGALTYHFNAGNTTTQGTIATPTDFEISDLRLQLNGVGEFTCWLFAVGLSKQRKARVSIMCDDGYNSYWRLGHPIWKAINVPQTMAVIATETGKSARYMTINDLKAWRGAGNSCVAHGPNGGAGSLISVYGADADFPVRALQDIKDNIDFLRDNSLATPEDLACYVYPQGEFQRTSNDTVLLEGIINQGLVNCARAARSLPVAFRPYIFNQDPLCKYQRLAMPIIGHSWAGSTAAEATKIANEITMIQECALYGLDFFLIFHEVKPNSTPDGQMEGIDIRVSDMQLLANAVKAEIDAGRLEAVHMRDFVAYDTVYQNY